MDVIRLRSGREVTIRPLRPDDGAPLQAAYDRLSPQSKYQRFLAPKPYLTEADVRFLVQIDGIDHVAIVATAVDNPDFIVGVARFVRLPEDPRTAEFAVVIGDLFQKDGLATELMKRLAKSAPERGITRFRATMLASNIGAHSLVRGLSATGARTRHNGPVDEIEFDLAA
jgi:RimJ/RimL family protein N-acetyltransferase